MEEKIRAQKEAEERAEQERLAAEKAEEDRKRAEAEASCALCFQRVGGNLGCIVDGLRYLVVFFFEC